MDPFVVTVMRNLRFILPWILFASLWAITIITTWVSAKFWTRYSYQKYITTHIDEVYAVELEERDKRIKSLSNDLGRVFARNKQLLAAHKTARTLILKQLQALTIGEEQNVD